MPYVGQTLVAQVRLGKRPEDCWTFLGPLTDGGYGKKQVGGRSVSAARWLWETLFGTLPQALVVIHTCGNRACMNPHHMRAGSHAEACRAGVGATLTPADVAEIKRAKKERSNGLAQHLATKFGCNRGLIFDIWAGRAWRKARGAAQQPTDPASTEGEVSHG